MSVQPLGLKTVDSFSKTERKPESCEHVRLFKFHQDRNPLKPRHGRLWLDTGSTCSVIALHPRCFRLESHTTERGTLQDSCCTTVPKHIRQISPRKAPKGLHARTTPWLKKWELKLCHVCDYHTNRVQFLWGRRALAHERQRSSNYKWKPGGRSPQRRSANGEQVEVGSQRIGVQVENDTGGAPDVAW